MKNQNKNDEVLTNQEIDEISRDLGYLEETIDQNSYSSKDEPNKSAIEQGSKVLNLDKFQPRLLSELKEEDFPIEWIWEGFLAKGYITLLSAFWKAGKTTLLALLLKNLSTNNVFLGQKINPANILILSEEGEGLWVRRRIEYNIETKTWILSRPIKQRLTYNEWISLLEQEAKFCFDNQVGVFIIDTISNFWSVINENDAPQVEAALLPINYLLANKVAVLLVHHFRKSGGEEGTASRGSGALSSKADIIIEFKRLQGEEDSTKRVLKCLSRFEETPSEIVIELDLDEGEYRVLGTKAEVIKEKKLDTFKEELENYPEGATINQVKEGWSDGKAPSERTLRRYANELEARREIYKSSDQNVGTTTAPIWKLTEDNLNRDVSVLTDPSTDTKDGQDPSPIELSTPGIDNQLLNEAEKIFGAKVEEE